MKKILVIVAVVIVAVVIFGAGAVFAQYQTAAAAGYGPGMLGAWNTQNGTPMPYGPGGMVGGRGGRGGYGPMHDYVEAALGAKLGLTEAQVETELTAGKNLSQIAIDHGTAEADVTALLTEVHKTAFAKAVTDGVLTQAQADAMLAQMTAQGFNFANCPMGGARPQDGSGYRGGGRGGPGGMMGNWQQPQPTTTP